MEHKVIKQQQNKNCRALISLFPQKPKKIALIVEGGGMRGMFAAGVLDSFYEVGFDPFHLYFGVSSGSLNLISHLAGQFQRNYRVVMFCATSGQFINSWKYLRGGHYVDLDWLSNECFEAVPLNKDFALQTLKDKGKRFVIVCTNVETGQPDYYSPTTENIDNMLIGSCCIPLFYRKSVYIAGVRVIDGGICDPIPVEKAYRDGATDIVVIRSREENHRESNNSIEIKIGSFLYKKHPKLQRAILNFPDTYNNSLSFMEASPPDVNIFQIAPQSCLSANLMSTNTKLLEMDYRLGRYQGKKFALNWSRHSQ